jgi:hypothetical protein
MHNLHPNATNRYGLTSQQLHDSAVPKIFPLFVQLKISLLCCHDGELRHSIPKLYALFIQETPPCSHVGLRSFFFRLYFSNYTNQTIVYVNCN